jgi:hypothetical protein
MDRDTIYYSRRAGEEREAAIAATNANAQETHLELAAAYEHRVRELEAMERRSGIHLVSAA